MNQRREYRTVPYETDFIRASGDCICSRCQKSYYRHEWVKVADTWEAHPLLLIQLCDGSFIKP